MDVDRREEVGEQLEEASGRLAEVAAELHSVVGPAARHAPSDEEAEQLKRRAAAAIHDVARMLGAEGPAAAIAEVGSQQGSGCLPGILKMQLPRGLPLHCLTRMHTLQEIVEEDLSALDESSRTMLHQSDGGSSAAAARSATACGAGQGAPESPRPLRLPVGFAREGNAERTL